MHSSKLLKSIRTRYCRWKKKKTSLQKIYNSNALNISRWLKRFWFASFFCFRSDKYYRRACMVSSKHISINDSLPIKNLSHRFFSCAVTRDGTLIWNDIQSLPWLCYFKNRHSHKNKMKRDSSKQLLYYV